MMSDVQSIPVAPPPLPDAVLTKCQAAEIIGLSPWTLDNMYRRGDGPKRLQLSERRVGYRRSEINRWLDSREAIQAAE